MMIAAIIAIFVFVTVVLYARRARRNTELLRHYAECMNSFLADSETLLASDETPAEVVDLIEFVADKAADRRGAQEFLSVVIRRRKDLSVRPAGALARQIDEFQKHITEQAPWVWLYSSPDYTAQQAWVSGFTPNSTDALYSLAHVQIAAH